MSSIMPEKAIKIVKFTVLRLTVVVWHFHDETRHKSAVNQLNVEFGCIEELRLAVVKKRK